MKKIHDNEITFLLLVSLNNFYTCEKCVSDHYPVARRMIGVIFLFRESVFKKSICKNLINSHISFVDLQRESYSTYFENAIQHTYI